MRKPTFIGNLVAWVAVAAACVAFLAWYHLTDFEVVAAAIGDSALGCAGVDRSKKGPFAKYLPSDYEDGRAA